MTDFKYRVSVIVPVYNVEKYLKKCLDSLVAQTMPSSDFEVLLVNDGSTDSSLQICEEYAKSNNIFKIFTKENEGLSATRNLAVSNAHGKYMLYLDSDDRITENTLLSLADFFDEHYDEVDLVTYKIVPIKKGVRKELHYRYQILKETGVYDLTQGDNIYITQTNVNIIVKNFGDENILFDTTKNYFHEDQQYCTDILRKKMKIGYVSGCEYLYEQNPQGLVSKFNPANIFFATIEKWEEMFDSFGDDIPQYIQELYFNDLRWKLKANVLLPWHLEGKAYDDAVGRLRNLLQKVDDSVILNHPKCDESIRYYIVSMKYNNELETVADSTLRLVHGEDVLYESDSVDLIISKIKVRGDKLEVCGHLSSPVFMYCDEPELVIRSRGNVYIPMLCKSSFCYDKTKVEDNKAWGFNQTFELTDKLSFGFLVRVCGKEYKVNLKTGEWVIFNKELGRNLYVQNGRKFSMSEKSILVEKCDAKTETLYKLRALKKYLRRNKKIFLVRLLNILSTLFMPKKRIWLYHDCNTVTKDNGYYQFIHDFDKNDGIERYYVVDGNIDAVRDMFTEKQQKYLIEFRSNKQKMLYLRAEKVITAFIDKVNYIPFYNDVYRDYMDLFSGEVIYLQHGVLHAHTPFKYSYDRLDVSAEVISTNYEEQNLTTNYCFPESALIKSKMPRYDFIDTDAENAENRILFAPSWRKYLIEQSGDGKWIPTINKFKESDYFRKTFEFLNSDALEALLEENDMYLDFQLHPIFKCYKELFEIANERVNVVENAVQSNYKIFVTDYSSFVFDFVYLNRPIVYFMPDYKEFKAGMNYYRQLDIPLEDGFGELTQTAEYAVNAIESIIKNGGKALPPFDEKYDKFFFNKEKNSREEIYNSLISR